MKPLSQWLSRAFLVLVATLVAEAAFAQTGVVLQGPTPVRQWRNASVVALSVPAGTVVEIIERDGDWCWVVLPPDTFGTRRVGWLPAAVLQISGTPPPEVLPSGIVPLPTASSDEEAGSDEGGPDVTSGAEPGGDTGTSASE